MSVYFFQGGPHVRDPIKIGWARSVVSRYSKLQGGCPNGLYFVAGFEGERTQEATLHTRFEHLRFRCEWFYAADDLIDFIEKAIRKKSIRQLLPELLQSRYGIEGKMESYAGHTSIGPYTTNFRTATWTGLPDQMAETAKIRGWEPPAVSRHVLRPDIYPEGGK